MNNPLTPLLAELKIFGQQHDQNTLDSADHMCNITHDTGAFLASLVQSMHAQHILEIGTSNGYATLWLADAAQRTGGTVTTIELSVAKAQQAKAHFERAHLTPYILQIQGDASHLLPDIKDNSFDLIFLDAQDAPHLEWWPHLRRAMRSSSVLVVNNVTFPSAAPTDLVNALRDDTGLSCKQVDIGRGVWLAVRTA